jgi:predicted Rossmann-fold nucleotide-binding protein
MSSQVNEDIRHIYLMTAGPALEALTLELEKHGRRVYLHTSERTASLTVRYEDTEIRYGVEVQSVQDRMVIYPMYHVRKGDGVTVTDGSYGTQDEAVSVTKEAIINHFLERYPPGEKSTS